MQRRGEGRLHAVSALCVTLLLQSRALQLQGDYSRKQQVHTSARARTHARGPCRVTQLQAALNASSMQWFSLYYGVYGFEVLGLLMAKTMVIDRLTQFAYPNTRDMYVLLMMMISIVVVVVVVVIIIIIIITIIIIIITIIIIIIIITTTTTTTTIIIIFY